jgi:internalin A
MRQLIRLKLRTAFAVVLLIGAWLGWLVHEARVQRRAVREIQNAGGKVWYQWQRDSFDDFLPNPDEPPLWPRWVVDSLGVDYFGHAVKVQFGGNGTSDRQLNHIRDLTRLEHLRLGIETGTDDGFKRILERLTNLRHLNLVGTGITNTGLSCVAGLEKLEELDLSYCPSITDAGLAHLKGLRSLRSLGLERTSISDAGLEHVAELRNLRELDISDDSIGDVGMAWLTGLNQLERLTAHCCRDVTDAGLTHLAGLSKLKQLFLGHSQITDNGLRCLKGLKSLQYLDTGNTHVTDAGVKDIQLALPKLEIFNPSHDTSTTAPTGCNEETLGQIQ